MLEKQFNPDLLYNRVVHFYMDKKGYSKDTARIRLCVTGWLSKNDIKHSLKVFDLAFKKFIKV